MIRASMERDVESEFFGAIFMCNQTTKQECFKRKVFGLPSALAKFLKKVKTGMFLFLFEHVERKLYGVFEATSDGAMNIVPNAFSKYGSSFPAQVRFKILWRCQPLTEDEFRNAIQENYFAPYKFNFGLTYEQVGKLIELFSLKKVSPLNSSSHSLHNKTNSEFTMEHYKEDSINFRSGFSVKRSIYNQNPSITFKDHNSAVEFKPQLPYLKDLSSHGDLNMQESFHISPKGVPLHQTGPNIEGEQPNPGREYFDTQARNLRSHSCQPLPYSDCYGISNGWKVTGVEVPDSTRRFAETQSHLSSSQLYPEEDSPRIRSHLYSSHAYPEEYSPRIGSHLYSYPEALNLPPADDYDHFVSTRSDKFPLPKKNYFNSTNYANYESTSKLCASNVENSYPFRLSPSNSHRYVGSSHEVDIARGSLELDNARFDCARGPRYLKSVPDNRDFSLNNNQNLVIDLEPPELLSGYSSDLYTVGDYENEGDNYFLPASKQYPTSPSSKYDPDMYQKNTSVFSRMSKTQKNYSQKVGTCSPDPDSLDLLSLLSQKRKQWNNNTGRASKKPYLSYNDTDNKKSKNLDQLEPIGVDSLVRIITDSEQFAEESGELPFINFKRRSEVQTRESEIVGSGSVGSDKGKGKRRKLLRPSFIKKFIDQTNSDCPLSENVCNDADNHANNGTLALALDLCDEIYMNSKNHSEGSKDFGKSKKPLIAEAIGNNVAMAGANTETFLVEPGCTKSPEERVNAVGENEEASDGNPRKCILDFDLNSEYISPDFNCEGGDSDGISKKKGTYRNPAFVNTEHAIFDADDDFNRKKICPESYGQYSKAVDNDESGTIDEGLTLDSKQNRVRDEGSEKTVVAFFVFYYIDCCSCISYISGRARAYVSCIYTRHCIQLRTSIRNNLQFHGIRASFLTLASRHYHPN